MPLARELAHRTSATAQKHRLRLSYALAIALSAFLLFQVQPIVARLLLPRFGGSAAVWATCLAFFQAVLLLGYLYANVLITRCSGRMQRWLHLIVLAASLATLPLLHTPEIADTSSPTLALIGALSGCIGLPYFSLSTTGPLLQAWHARKLHSEFPYRLYALSNLASMLALVSYPIAIEPTLTLDQQTLIWRIGYALFVIACGAVTWRVATHAASSTRESNVHVNAQRQGSWIGLALVPALLLVAVTTHLTQNIAPIPLLWIVPLALYLLSFVLCFDRSTWYRRRVFVPLLLLTLLAMTYALIDNGAQLGLRASIATFCTGLFAASMVCHGELARARPPASMLTRYYLLIAFGGMLGGAFVALVAPVIFQDYYELPLGLAFCAMVALVVAQAPVRQALAWSPRSIRLASALIIVALALALAYRPFIAARESRVIERNFYGVVRTKDWGGGEGLRRTLHHGRIIHGMQLVDARWRRFPTTYYGAQSGVGLALDNAHRERAQRVGVIGLGTGTLAAYGRSGDTYRFYEINPTVVALAYTEFSFLRDSSAAIRIARGDARLTLQREAPNGFDVLVVDAFSSDSVPTHLLTREAFALYREHLSPDGVLAINVSNHYLDLAPVVQRSASAVGMETRILDTTGDAQHVVYSATWAIATRTSSWFARPALQQLAPIRDTAFPTWTDNFSSLYSVVR